MNALIKAAEELIEFIEQNETCVITQDWMNGDNDADIIDKVRTALLLTRSNRLKRIIARQIPQNELTTPSMELIKKCFAQ